MIELDNRIKSALNSCISLNKRCVFFLTGPQASQNVPIVISMREYDINYDPKILWCFKRDNHYIKRGGKSNRKFDHDINWCHYNDTDFILGQTFDVCVLQDFDSLTPNKLAKTIETVQGGGLIIFLLTDVDKVSDFGAMEMDAHKKYKTFAFNKIHYRFNYRLFYSLINFNDCFLLNNDLQTISINNNFLSSSINTDAINEGKRTKALIKLKKKLAGGLNGNVTKAVDLCATKDQTKGLTSLLQLIDNNRNESSTTKFGTETPKSEKLSKRNELFNHEPHVALVTSSRGRGKSSLLGLAISVAVDRGLSRICVTSPHLANVSALMQFVIHGLKAMGYEENRDFIKRTKSMDSDNKMGIVEIEVVKNFQRQIVKYISADDKNHTLDRFDLICIDETAAIPLPIVRRILSMKCDLFFMASTIHGYEGTGRSLSLKLMKQIRDRFQTSNGSSDHFLEITLKEPVRYSREDNVEKWLYDLLCLDCGTDSNEFDNYQPSVNDCQLFLVNRDVLFSGDALSEKFLQKIMSIYVSSHYKNTPNDLQMLADSSSHSLFCLAKPSVMENGLPIVTAVIQVALEGSIDPIVARTSLEKGNRPSGDMIPWTIVQQFNRYEFAKLAGARIVRIAVPHNLQRQGYGARALKLLYEHFDKREKPASSRNPKSETASLNEIVTGNEKLNNLMTVTGLPPLEKLGSLLVNTSDIVPESLDYIGVSYGLTSDLLRFWKKNEFMPLYLRQTMNDTTGEHSCIMIRPLSHSEKLDGQSDWVNGFYNDFCRRFCNLLPGPFKPLNAILALEILHPKSKAIKTTTANETVSSDLMAFVSKNDLERVDKYLRGMIDYHGIMDLAHVFALIVHTKRICNIKLPKFQQLVLLGLGLQYKSVDELVQDFAVLESLGTKTSGSEILGHLKESLRAITKSLKSLMK